MKPTISLLGDRYKAAQFIRFAERKLAEMKQVMNLQRLNMQNRLIRFTPDDIEVYIESYLGIDKIRIKAEEGAVCVIRDFTADVTEGSAPLEVTFTQTRGGYIHEDDIGFIEWLWDFGDGTFSSAATENPTHTYEEAGTYTVKLIAIDKNHASPWGGSFRTGINSGSSGIVRTARGSSNASAFANFLATVTTATVEKWTGPRYTVEYSSVVPSAPYKYTAVQKFRPYNINFSHGNEAWLSAHQPRVDNIENGGVGYNVKIGGVTIGSGPPDRIKKADTNDPETVVVISNLDNFIGANTVVEIAPDTTYSILTTPLSSGGSGDFGGEINGWAFEHELSTSDISGLAFMARPYSCKSEKTKKDYITVT